MLAPSFRFVLAKGCDENWGGGSIVTHGGQQVMEGKMSIFLISRQVSDNVAEGSH